MPLRHDATALLPNRRAPLAAIAALLTAALGGGALGGACGTAEEGGALQPAGDAGAEPVQVAGELTATTDCGLCGGGCTHETWVYHKAWHEWAPLVYQEQPPSGGSHDSCWWSWGSYTVPVPPRRFVHNLEHGGLVLTWDCPDGCPAEVALLEQAGVASKLQVIVTPFAGAKAKFVALCWQHRLLLDCVDQEAVAAIAAFGQLHCPDAPEQVTMTAPAGCM